MSGQEGFLQNLDATIIGALSGAGMGDAAIYTGVDRNAIACAVLVDHNVEFFGDDPSKIVGTKTVVRFQSAEVPAPERGGKVVVGSRTYRLDKEVDREPGISSRWVVIHD